MKHLTRNQILNGRGAQPIRNAMAALRQYEAAQRAQADGQEADAPRVVAGHHSRATGLRVLLQDGSVQQVIEPQK